MLCDRTGLPCQHDAVADDPLFVPAKSKGGPSTLTQHAPAHTAADPQVTPPCFVVNRQLRDLFVEFLQQSRTLSWVRSFAMVTVLTTQPHVIDSSSCVMSIVLRVGGRWRILSVAKMMLSSLHNLPDSPSTRPNVVDIRLCCYSVLFCPGSNSWPTALCCVTHRARGEIGEANYSDCFHRVLTRGTHSGIHQI